MKTILLPTDFSTNSRNAISYAINFYRYEPCRFILLHCYDIDGYRQNSIFIPVPGKEESDKVKADAEKELNILTQQLKIGYPFSQHTYQQKVQNYSLVDAIKSEIKNENIEVVIIGTQGSTAAQYVSYGSNTINIMEEVQKAPILAIPSHVKFSAIKEIVLASGFKITPQEEEFKFLKEILRKTKAALRVLHIKENNVISKKQTENRDKLHSLLKDIPHTFHTLEHVSVPIGIYCFTESRQSDMIAFINKRHSFYQNVLFNPLYKNLGNYSQIPVFILQSNN